MRPPTDFLFSFLFPLLVAASLPLRKRGALLSASQPFKVNSPPGDVLLGKGWGRREGGGQIKAAFEVSIIFGMLLRV